MGQKAKITQTTTSREKKSDSNKGQTVRVNKVTGEQKVFAKRSVK